MHLPRFIKVTSLGIHCHLMLAVRSNILLHCLFHSNKMFRQTIIYMFTISELTTEMTTLQALKTFLRMLKP